MVTSDKAGGTDRETGGDTRRSDRAVEPGLAGAGSDLALVSAQPTSGRLLTLQGIAGNRAVTRLIHLQRAPKDLGGATDPITNVKGSGITRVKVDGLKFGQSSDFQKTYPTLDGDKDSDERNKTDESPIHTAILLVPDKLIADQPIQVLLHFHGWGFRSGDPYAGYLKGKDKGNTYRDVDQEHLEQQIGPLEAKVSGGSPQIVGILAQGIGTSKFGDVPTFEYVKDVLTKSGRFSNPLPRFSLILSAHSGGGSNQVVPDMKAGQADTSSGSSATDKLAPVDLIVLFEALNGDSDVNGVVAWVDKQLARLSPVLQKAAPGDKDAKTALDSTPKLRGYFGDRGSGYATRYMKLSGTISDHIRDQIPEAWQLPVHDLFRIVRVVDPHGRFDSKDKDSPTVEHEEVISGKGKAEEGSMAAAIKASRDPTIDRAEDVENERAPKTGAATGATSAPKGGASTGSGASSGSGSGAGSATGSGAGSGSGH